MQVVNKELFHIHIRNCHQEHWNPGNTLETPKDDFNYYYKGLLTQPHSKVSSSLQQFDLIDYLNKNLDDFENFNDNIDQQEINQDSILNIQEFNSHILYLLNHTLQSLAHSRKMLREVIFEDYRLKYCPNLPSRQSCIWLSEKEQLEYWWTEFKDFENKMIYKVSVTGNMFYADSSFIQMDIFKLNDFTDMALKYWQGQFATDTELILKEILFEGTINIISQYNHPSEI